MKVQNLLFRSTFPLLSCFDLYFTPTFLGASTNPTYPESVNSLGFVGRAVPASKGYKAGHFQRSLGRFGSEVPKA